VIIEEYQWKVSSRADPVSVIERRTRPPAAVRVLARAWTYVIWRCWQDGIPYDPAKHQALQALPDDQPPRAA